MSLSGDDVAAVIEAALAPGRMFTASAELVVEHRPRETTPWEIFLGHLLSPRQTRLERTFASWHVATRRCPTDRPLRLLSIRLDAPGGQLHVTRELSVHGQEAFESEPNVISTRPAIVVARELVATLELTLFARPEDLSVELRHALLLATVGTSRLPITSLESPLPSFSLGQFAYASTGPAAAGAEASPLAWIERALGSSVSHDDRARRFEFALRTLCPGELPELCRRWLLWSDAGAVTSDETVRLVKTLFNQVALTPWTGLSAHLLALLRGLAAGGCLSIDDHIDLVSYQLRYVVRHLTAFDLRQFHNLGTNYPDALVLDEALAEYLDLMQRHPAQFMKQSEGPRADLLRRRRRALRQAWLVRQQYVNHPVPAHPTSPGENARVTVEGPPRVPDEQLFDPRFRPRRLFTEPVAEPASPAVSDVLRQSVADWAHPQELVETGLGLFLDRPLGLIKEPGEVDRTPLLSYEAFSATIVYQRLAVARTAGWLSGDDETRLTALVSAQAGRGLPACELPARDAPGVVGLEDARRAAHDFRFLRTTRRSLAELLACYQWSALDTLDPAAARWLLTASDVLLVRTAARDEAISGRPCLMAFDRDLQPRLTFALPLAPGRPAYRLVHGDERLVGGLLASGIRGTACIAARLSPPSADA